MKIEKIALALFDFDDTLCVHTHRPIKSPEKYVQINLHILAGVDPWPEGEVPSFMYSFLHLCDSRQIPMGLISSTASYIRAEAKVAWVKRRYLLTLRNYCVASAEGKVGMMHTLATHFELSPRQILYVDDSHDNLERAAAEGFTACSPLEIERFMANG